MVSASRKGLAEPFGADCSGIDVEVDEMAGDVFYEGGRAADVGDIWCCGFDDALEVICLDAA